MNQYVIRSDESPNFSLVESNTEKSILQNIYSIITTPQGSIPMYREFGLPMAYLGKPENVIETIATAEVLEALSKFEPRAVLGDVRCENTENKITVIVEVNI